MRQTQLALLGGCGELGTQTITDPARRMLPSHYFLNDLRPATRPDEEIHSQRTPQDPLPPRPPGYARTRLVTADDRTLRHLGANLFGYRLRRHAGPLQECARPPFADRHAKEVLTELRHALIAQMLLVFEIAYRRSQPRPETPSAVQPHRQLSPGDLLTVRTDHRRRARLNHHGRDWGHFRQLVAEDGPGLDPTEVRLTVSTALHGGLNNPVRLCHPGPCLARMPKRGPVLLALALPREVALHVPGRRLRGVLRRRRWGRGFPQLGLELLVLCLQPLHGCDQLFDQRYQLRVGQLRNVFGRRQCHHVEQNSIASSTGSEPQRKCQKFCE